MLLEEMFPVIILLFRQLSIIVNSACFKLARYK